MSFGILYWLIPKMWGTQLFSKKLANLHFWISTLGIVFYAIPLYWAGIAQALMWKQFTPLGVLQYPNFLETVLQILPMYVIRSFGGLLYLLGVFLMIYNLLVTAKQGSFIKNEEAEAAPINKANDKIKRGMFHRWLEKRPVKFALLSLVAILIGGMVQIIPMLAIESNIPTISSVKPYTPLELQGRDIYIREGCVSCHSQLIRPFRSETERYGEYTKAGEHVYEHPFLWGSKRTGPDLQRLGGKYGNLWHYMHMEDPRSMSPGSIMPPYPWLFTQTTDISTTKAKINAMRSLGVPYAMGYEEVAEQDLLKQADSIAKDLINNGVPAESDKEIIALIAYMQRLGTDIKGNKTEGK